MKRFISLIFLSLLSLLAVNAWATVDVLEDAKEIVISQHDPGAASVLYAAAEQCSVCHAYEVENRTYNINSKSADNYESYSIDTDVALFGNWSKVNYDAFASGNSNRQDE